MPIFGVFRFCNRHGRLILIAGLVAGIILPDLALYMKAQIPPLVALLLFANAFRIGWTATAGSLKTFFANAPVVLLLQLVLPVGFAIAFMVSNLAGPIAIALVIMAAAPSIGGSPNITRMLGHDPAPALQLLILGTALLPLTAAVVFGLAMPLGSMQTLMDTIIRLIIVIFLATGTGFAARHFLTPDLDSTKAEIVDGASVLLMAILVVGLVSAFGPALFNAPLQLALTLLMAFLANFGLQLLALVCFTQSAFNNARVAISVVAGNRNMALFLAVLPETVIEPILLFIACYQIPMYLTPTILARLHAPPRRK